MTAEQFLNNNNVTAVETIEHLIVNLVCGEALYGIDVDLTQFEGNPSVIRTTDFTIDYENGTLITGDITVDIDKTKMLNNDTLYIN
jgi:hypothetical protein